LVIRKSAVAADIGLEPLHNEVESNALVARVGVHLVGRVPARWRIRVSRLFACETGRRGYDAILLTHNLAAADFDQRLPQLLIGRLDMLQDQENTELNRVVGAPNAVRRPHLLVADKVVDQLEQPLDSSNGI
jgi:hypothetical protein